MYHLKIIAQFDYILIELYKHVYNYGTLNLEHYLYLWLLSVNQTSGWPLVPISLDYRRRPTVNKHRNHSWLGIMSNSRRSLTGTSSMEMLCALSDWIERYDSENNHSKD